MEATRRIEIVGRTETNSFDGYGAMAMYKLTLIVLLLFV